MTGSLIGIMLMVLYGAYISLSTYYKAKKTFLTLCIMVVLIGGITFFLTKENPRWLSLLSRFFLMQETLREYSLSFSHILFGSGPNGLISLWEHTRTPSLDQYFPRSMIIDSSHNGIIDIFVMFGVV